jgi:HlyD family secretion protein
MNRASPSPHLAISGATMDKLVPKKRRNKTILIGIAATIVTLVCSFAVWHAIPRGLQVAASEVRIAGVEKGLFEDKLIVRANTAPLRSIFLDSVESGRVEEVNVRDGTLVTKGQLLFRLSNAQRNIDLLTRQEQHALQISNLANLQVTQEASVTEHQRRLSELKFALVQAEKKHARDVKLANQGFISSVALEESNDQLEQQQQLVKEEMQSNETGLNVRNAALARMESAIKEQQSGLQLVQASVEALAVRASAAGRLTGFNLQVGETVKTDDHIGRIDDPSVFKLTAQVDEFYLNRITVGRHGTVRQGERDYAVEVSAVYPQIKDGRFTVDMVFGKGQPEALSPGQSLDVEIALGEPAQALLLPNGAFVNDSGGVWVFVVGADGRNVERRDIKIGRRSNSQIEVLSGLAVGEKVIISSYAAFGKSQHLQLTD